MSAEGMEARELYTLADQLVADASLAEQQALEELHKAACARSLESRLYHTTQAQALQKSANEIHNMAVSVRRTTFDTYGVAYSPS